MRRCVKGLRKVGRHDLPSVGGEQLAFGRALTPGSAGYEDELSRDTSSVLAHVHVPPRPKMATARHQPALPPLILTGNTLT